MGPVTSIQPPSNLLQDSEKILSKTLKVRTQLAHEWNTVAKTLQRNKSEWQSKRKARIRTMASIESTIPKCGEWVNDPFLPGHAWAGFLGLRTPSAASTTRRFTHVNIPISVISWKRGTQEFLIMDHDGIFLLYDIAERNIVYRLKIGLSLREAEDAVSAGIIQKLPGLMGVPIRPWEAERVDLKEDACSS